MIQAVLDLQNARFPRRSTLQRSLGLLVFLLAVAAQASVAPRVTAVVSSVKVRPADAPAAQASAEIRAARNEFEAFQLVILGGSTGLTQVRVTHPTLTLVGGASTVPASEVRLYREQVTRFSQPSALDGAAGAWPDALIPEAEDGFAVATSSGGWGEVASANELRNAFPTQVDANLNTVIWVEVHVPTDAAPGRYTGALVVTGNAQGTPFSATLPVGLQVRPFTLPSTSSLPTLFQLSVDNVCRAHGTVDGNNFCPDLPTQRMWNRLYARFLLDHRISAQLADSANAADWNASTTAYDRAYGDLIQGTDPGSRLHGAALTTVEYPWWQSGASAATQVDRMRRWATHARAGQWFQKTLDYSGDEPGSDSVLWGKTLTRAGWAHQADAAFRTLVTAPVGAYNLFAGATSGAINVLTPVLDNVDGWSGSGYAGNQRDAHAGDTYAGFLALQPHNQVWGYQSCDQHGCSSNTDAVAKNGPSFMVDASGLQNRAQPWMHYIYGLTGMLYYDTTLALPTAWNPDGITAFTGNGDGTFLYPGTPAPVGRNTVGIGGATHIPVASLRLKMLRDGLEDYEYLKLCEARDPAHAMRVARALFPMTAPSVQGRESGSMQSAGNYPQSTPLALAASLESAREELATCITGIPAGNPVPSGPVLSVQLGSPGADEVHATATDAAGNVYLTGSTTGTLDWGNSGGADAFVTKRDASGKAMWTRQLGSARNDVALGMAVDAQGNVFIVGSTEASLYDPYQGGARDAFLAKYDAAGNRLFSHNFGSSDDDLATAVAVDGSGNVFVGGATRGVLDWGSSGGWDAFVAKFDGRGNALWTRQLGSAGDDAVTAVAADAAGGVYLTGTCTQALYDAYQGGARDGFLAGFTAAGNRRFAHSFGTPGDDAPSGLAVDASGNLYVAGSTDGSFRGTNAGGWDATVSRFTSEGVSSWRVQFGTAGDDVATGLGIAASGHLYVTGWTSGGFGSYRGGSSDAFLAKLSLTGAQEAVQSWGTPSADSGSALAVDAAGNVWVGGTTAGGLGATNAGGEDAFLSKFTP